MKQTFVRTHEQLLRLVDAKSTHHLFQLEARKLSLQKASALNVESATFSTFDKVLQCGIKHS